MTEHKLQLADWLDDLCVRFIVNLPHEELESVERICFQVEEAQWFYEDFIRPLDPSMPSLPLKQFCLKIFQHCPLFSSYDVQAHTKAFEEFLAYKTRVPVRGAIMLNDAMDSVVLVKGWRKNANWSFPRGKINKDEKDLDCAIREVYEETGYDLRVAGRIENEEDVKSIEITMREQHMKLFVFTGIPMDTYFEPRTRKEISKIQWYKLSELPTGRKLKQQQHGEMQQASIESAQQANKFYMVAPFLEKLKRIIAQERKLGQKHSSKLSGKITAEELAKALHEESESQTLLHPKDDVSRLMAQLRQSKQDARDRQLPELSDSGETFSNMPHYLMPRGNGSLDGFETVQDPSQLNTHHAKAQAMLSLLRSSGGTGSSQIQQQLNLPHTPFEQPNHGSSQVPRSPSPERHPKHHSLAGLPPPPLFTLPRTAPAPATYQQNYQAIQTTSSATDRHLIRQGYPQNLAHQFAQFHSQPRHSDPLQAPVLAPYQRTGDPQFSQNNGPIHDLPSLVPSADKLPIPKLNAQSSVLLGLFKAPSVKSPPTATISEAPALPVGHKTPPFSKESFDGIHQAPKFSKLNLPSTNDREPDAHPEVLTQPMAGQASQQQSTLLDLFRNSDATPAKAKVAATSSPAQLAADPVELAAHRTPAHSRVDSMEFSTRQTQEKVYKPVKILTNPASRSHQQALGSPPLPSATVTGPLPTPQFDKILRRPIDIDSKASVSEAIAKRTSKSPALEQPKSAKLEASVTLPVKILSRPNTAGKDAEKSGSEKASPARRDKNPTRMQKQSHKGKQTAPAMKPFAPQILKRPQSAHSAENHPQQDSRPDPPEHSRYGIPLVDTHEKSYAQQNAAAEQPTNPPSEQKQTLLSLFTKTKVDVSPPTPKSGPEISPVSEKPGPGSSFGSPLMSAAMVKPTARLGSIQSLDHGPLASMQSPKSAKSVTSPADKQFLLGFLDGVLKGNPSQR